MLNKSHLSVEGLEVVINGISNTEKKLNSIFSRLEKDQKKLNEIN